MKIDRLLSIVIMLLNRNRVQASELAEYFGVSTRTIYRDIDAINRAGIPVVTHQGNKGGVGIIDGYRLDRQVLTLDDMVSMLSILKGVNSTFQDRRIDSAIEKLHALIPAQQQGEVKKKSSTLLIDVMPWGIRHQEEKIETLQQAIGGNVLIHFSYRDSEGIRSRRLVEPMTLVFKSTAWYLFAYCRLRNDFRLFRLTRMTELTLRGEKFRRRPGQYRHNNSQHTGNTRMIKLTVRFSASIQHTVEDYFEESFLQYQDNGDIVATFELPETDWILSWLLGLGDKAELIEPQEMRDRLRKKAEKIIKMYQT
ncbi:helix-turn-helix transcriptional regulator [Desulfomarina sp.]